MVVNVGFEVLEILTQKVRVLTDNQVSRVSFQHTKQPAVVSRQWLRRQEKAGMLSLHELMTHPEIDVSKPLLDFHPGSPTPDFDALAWQAQSRWTSVPKQTLVATATKKAKQLTAGPVGGRPIRAREATHDIHCSAVYLHFRQHQPELAKRWLPEDAVSHLDGNKVPDAIITGDEPIIVEFAGAYAAQKMRGIHAEFCNRRYQFY